MTLPSTFLSKLLYDALVAHYPVLARHRDYREFTAHLLFKAARDKRDPTRRRVAQKFLAHALGQERDLRWRKFAGLKFLKAYQRDVTDPSNRNIPLVTDISDYGPKRSRTVAIVLPGKLPDLIDSEPLRLLNDPSPVCLALGCTTSKSARSRLVAEERKLLASEVGKHPSRDGELWLRYLNNQRGNVLSSLINRNYNAAVAKLLGGPKKSRDGLSMQLAAIKHFPVPLFHVSPRERSHRIFANHPSLATIDSEYRHILMRGCYECDIKSAIYRIVAAMWKLPLATQFLRAGGDIWKELAMAIGVAPTSKAFEVFKTGFKPTFNAIVNQAELQEIKYHSTRLLMLLHNQNSADAILSHPLMMELLDARNMAGKQVLLTGAAHSCYGLRLLLKDHENIRSLISNQASSYELALLTPALKAVLKSDRAAIVLYQSDGFTLHVRDRRRATFWKDKLSSAMKLGAAKLGVDLDVTWKDL